MIQQGGYYCTHFIDKKTEEGEGLSGLPEIIKLERKDLNPGLSIFKESGVSMPTGFQGWILQVSCRGTSSSSNKKHLD